MTFFINYLSPGKLWKSIYIGLGVLNIEIEIEAMALAKHVVRREKVKDGALRIYLRDVQRKSRRHIVKVTSCILKGKVPLKKVPQVGGDLKKVQWIQQKRFHENLPERSSAAKPDFSD